MGFNQNFINNIRTNLNHPPEKVQECLEAFAHDIEAEGGTESYKKNHRLNSPRGWFFNSMKVEGGYISTTGNFISEAERAKETMLEILRKREEKRKKREKEIQELSFQSMARENPR